MDKATRCEQIMKRHVHTVRESDTVAQAASVMFEADVGFLPVCDASGVAIGVLTDRDIVIRVCATRRDPETTLVRDAMTPGLIACRPDQSLAHAEAIMRKHRILRVIVSDEEGTPRGIISISDVVQYETPERIARALYDISSRKYGTHEGP